MDVKLSVNSVTGQKMATLVASLISAGIHSAVFDGMGLASGSTSSGSNHRDLRRQARC